MGYFRVRKVLAGLALFLAGTSVALAQEEPEWEFEFVENEIASAHNVKWFPKDDGWLMTFQLRVTSINVIPAITHVELEGFDEEEESVWSKTQIVREHKFDGGFFGGKAQFVRVMIEDAPEGIVLVKMRYLDGHSDEGE